MEMISFIILLLIVSNTLAFYPRVEITNKLDSKVNYTVYYWEFADICREDSEGVLEPGQNKSHSRDGCLITRLVDG